MKKLFTLFMALSLIAGLNAAPIAALSQKKVVKTEKVEKVQKLEFDASMVNVAMDRFANNDLIKRIAVKFAEGEEGGEEGGQGQGGEGGDDPIVETAITLDFDAVDVTFLGNYFLYFSDYEMYIPFWEVMLTNAADTLDLMYIVGNGDTKHIAYSDTTQIAYLYGQSYEENVEIINSQSLLTVEYVSAEQDGTPIYRFAGNFLGDDGERYEFDVQFPVQAYDLAWYIACDYGMTTYCDQMDMFLEDAPADPIVEIIDVPIGEGETQAIFSEDLDMTLYSIDNEDYEAAIAVKSAEQAGVFGIDDCDASQSSLSVGGEEQVLDSIKGSVVDNGDGTFNYEFTIYPKYGGYAYHFHGVVGEAKDLVWSVDATQDLDVTFNGTMDINSDWLADDKYIHVACTDVEETEELALYFNITALDPTTQVPVGVYPINGTMAIGTCDAAIGLVYSETAGYYYPQAPYFAYLDEDGYEAYPLWFIVDGSVTVTYEQHLRIEITGHNHNGNNVHIVFDNTASGLEEVVANSNIRKFIDNGQIMVVRDGKVFNILGARVK